MKKHLNTLYIPSPAAFMKSSSAAYQQHAYNKDGLICVLLVKILKVNLLLNKLNMNGSNDL